MDPICSANCEEQDLPIFSVDDCNTEILKSGINMLLFAKVSADSLDDWQNPAEWATRLSNSSTNANAIRYIKGTGALPEATVQTITYQVNKTKNIGKTRTLTFTVEEANLTIHDLFRHFECGGQYRWWFRTVGGRLYGGNDGITADQAANLVLNSGPEDYEQRTLALSWDAKFMPEATNSPIEGLTEDLPVVFDTILEFDGGTEDVEEGVTGTISGSANDTSLFEFNKIPSLSGAPNDMTINVNGVESIVLAFPADYVGRPFRYTTATGGVHNGTFINGIRNFTESASS